MNDELRNAEAAPLDLVIKNDREFWLNMAARWEGVLKGRPRGDDAPVMRAYKFRRSRVLTAEERRRRAA